MHFEQCCVTLSTLALLLKEEQALGQSVQSNIALKPVRVSFGNCILIIPFISLGPGGGEKSSQNQL